MYHIALSTKTGWRPTSSHDIIAFYIRVDHLILPVGRFPSLLVRLSLISLIYSSISSRLHSLSHCETDWLKWEDAHHNGHDPCRCTVHVGRLGDRRESRSRLRYYYEVLEMITIGRSFTCTSPVCLICSSTFFARGNYEVMNRTPPSMRSYSILLLNNIFVDLLSACASVLGIARFEFALFIFGNQII